MSIDDEDIEDGCCPYCFWDFDFSNRDQQAVCPKCGRTASVDYVSIPGSDDGSVMGYILQDTDDAKKRY